MTGKTNYTAIDDGKEFGFDQINALGDHFDALTGESVATPADLPASGNWTGRTILVQSEGVSYAWVTSAWRALAGYAQWATTTPLSGARLDTPEPLQYWWDGKMASLEGVMWVTAPATWQVGWNICANLPADSGNIRVRPRKTHLVLGRSGTAVVQIKITTAGVVTLDQVLLGTTADYIVVMGVPWPTRP